MQRLDAIHFKKTQSGKTIPVRLGSAAPNQNGDGYMLFLDAVPAPENGTYRISLVPPREQQQTQATAPGPDDDWPGF